MRANHSTKREKKGKNRMFLLTNVLCDLLNRFYAFETQIHKNIDWFHCGVEDCSTRWMNGEQLKTRRKNSSGSLSRNVKPTNLQWSQMLFAILFKWKASLIQLLEPRERVKNTNKNLKNTHAHRETEREIAAITQCQSLNFRYSYSAEEPSILSSAHSIPWRTYRIWNWSHNYDQTSW